MVPIVSGKSGGSNIITVNIHPEILPLSGRPSKGVERSSAICACTKVGVLAVGGSLVCWAAGCGANAPAIRGPEGASPSRSEEVAELQRLGQLQLVL